MPLTHWHDYDMATTIYSYAASLSDVDAVGVVVAISFTPHLSICVLLRLFSHCRLPSLAAFWRRIRISRG